MIAPTMPSPPASVTAAVRRGEAPPIGACWMGTEQPTRSVNRVRSILTSRCMDLTCMISSLRSRIAASLLVIDVWVLPDRRLPFAYVRAAIDMQHLTSDVWRFSQKHDRIDDL